MGRAQVRVLVVMTLSPSHWESQCQFPEELPTPSAPSLLSATGAPLPVAIVVDPRPEGAAGGCPRGWGSGTESASPV